MNHVTLNGNIFSLNIIDSNGVKLETILKALKNNELELANSINNEELLIVDDISVVCSRNEKTINVLKVISSLNTF